MRKIKDVLRLQLDAKMSHQQIAAALGIWKGVVAKYVGLAAAAGLDWTAVPGLGRGSTGTAAYWPPPSSRAIVPHESDS